MKFRNRFRFVITQYVQLDVLSPSSKNTLTTLDGNENTSLDVISNKKAEKQINEDVRNMMTNLFANLEEELNTFIELIEKQDSLYVFILF